MARARKTFDIRKFAVVGAQARLQELMSEARHIVAAFPELAREVGIVAAGAARGAIAGARKATRRRRAMSAAQRKEVSARMRKYWAERRKGKVGATAGKRKKTAAQ